MEILRRWREPVAITLLVASAVRLLAGIVAVPVFAADDAWGSVATAALFQGSRAADPVLLVVTAAAAACCLLWPQTPRGRTIAALALIETAAAVLVSLVFGLMGLTSDAPGPGVEFVQLLAVLAVPGVAAALLLALLRASPELGPVTSPDPSLPPPAMAQAPPPPPALPASWQPEQATGIVWQTAGDAAAGAPPAGWPTAGEATGWQPIPGPPAERDPHRAP